MINAQRHTSCVTDALVCALLRAWQTRLPANVCTLAQLENYLQACDRLCRETFFRVEAIAAPRSRDGLLCWPTPAPSAYPEKNHAWAKAFWTGNDRERFRAPTVIFLHALMSTGDFGYSRIAGRFNASGWNAVLVQLPYHGRGSSDGHLPRLRRLGRR